LVVPNPEPLAHFGNVHRRTSPADHVVLMPAHVREVGNLVNMSAISNSAAVKPRLREEVVGFTCRATALRGWVEEVLQ
jgi:hypothetical protein